MIIKSFNLNEIKQNTSNYFLFYGENEGHKEEVISNFFLKNFKGEIISYDEDQILKDRQVFFESCLNDSLFESEKIILVKRVTSKIYEIIKDLTEKNITNKKIILNSSALDRKSKIRKMFETEKKLVCIPFYQDNQMSLFKIANDFFKAKKISISSENINLVVEQCSGDRKNLYNEMNKILNFCLSKNKINREEILKLINLHNNENYFELIDNCLAKNRSKVNKIINNNNYSNNESIILIRSLLARLKRLIELKKLQSENGSIKSIVDNFKPPIFWKDKEIVQKQIKIWDRDKIYELLDEVNKIEIQFKRNSNLSNNLIFDLLISASNN